MLILVVGPSGAGKDTVLSLARATLANDRRFRFVRRVITRPAEAGGEDHEAVLEADFGKRLCAFRWQAHGLHYGIPADIADDLENGIAVVANVSRSIIADAAQCFPVHVIEVSAPVEVLAQRLAARGRETQEAVIRRLSRDVSIPPQVPIDRIVNDRTPGEAADRFIAALIRAASSARR